MDLAKQQGLKVPDTQAATTSQAFTKDSVLTPMEKSLANFVREGGRSIASTATRFVTKTLLQKFDPAGVGITQAIPESVNIPGLGDIQIRQAKEPMRELGFLMEDIANVYSGGGVSTLASTPTRQVVKEGIKVGARTGAVAGGLTGAGQALQEEKPFGEAGLKGLFGAGLGAIVGGAIGGATSTLGRMLFGTPIDDVRSVDELIDRSDDALIQSRKLLATTDPEDATRISGELLETVQEQAPELSIKEKMVGMRPDIKNRIQGKQQELATYFNIAEARNRSDQVPTPLEFAARKVDVAEKMTRDILGDTGSQIGAFRRKIETVQASSDDVVGLMSSFSDELGKLNLEIKNGQIRQMGGKVSILKPSEIPVLQRLYKNLRIVRQSPNAANLIDSRVSFDSQINFAKQAGEVSGAVDPLSRKVRSTIAEINRKLIGKEQSQSLSNYESVITALHELQGYTDRRAGAEFMLKRVLSERGGEARAIIETIKNLTGIDLMDDATMAMIATDILGNQSQKGLFRQEISKAGLDAMDLLRGGKVGILSTLVEKTVERVAPIKEIFLGAAK